ncbi:MAG: D-alanyl-D-alanine carboxypeptidase [Clostridia bacterium]|nr:D-alanyl-D-alanine carboxypeptidase [Clostridia bacterium]
MFFRKSIPVVLTVALLMWMISFGGTVKTRNEELSLSAESAVLICADSGQMLYEKAPDRKMAIASITKIMTAVIALEHADTDDKEIRFTKDMAAEGSSLYLQDGEVLTLSQLTAGMMCVSGNDAANAVAVGIAGSLDKFAVLMNEKAAAIGMSSTHFVTPSGLDDDEHYSTAMDMAKLCRYAMSIESFRNIVSQKSLTVSYISPKGKTQSCTNHNKLLSTYPGCIGIKTGFTKKAGRTLTSCAERDGVRLIAVTLNAPDDWNDHKKLFDYGFSVTEGIKAVDAEQRFELPVAGGVTDFVLVKPKDDCICTVTKDEQQEIRVRVFMPHFVYAPQKNGSTAGKICCYMNGSKVAETELIYTEDIISQTEQR